MNAGLSPRVSQYCQITREGISDLSGLSSRETLDVGGQANT
jgi:hypothetical protein